AVNRRPKVSGVSSALNSILSKADLRRTVLLAFPHFWRNSALKVAQTSLRGAPSINLRAQAKAGPLKTSMKQMVLRFSSISRTRNCSSIGLRYRDKLMFSVPENVRVSDLRQVDLDDGKPVAV